MISGSRPVVAPRSLCTVLYCTVRTGVKYLADLELFPLSKLSRRKGCFSSWRRMSLAACQPGLESNDSPQYARHAGTPAIAASQCQPSGTYRQVPSHGVAFCPFEPRAVSSHRPCLSGCVPVRVISMYCACAVDHDAVQLRHHMYASWARIALSITPRRRTLGAVDLVIYTHVCCMHCEFPLGADEARGHCTSPFIPPSPLNCPMSHT